MAYCLSYIHRKIFRIWIRAFNINIHHSDEGRFCPTVSDSGGFCQGALVRGGGLCPFPLRYSTHCQNITVLRAHPTFHPQVEWDIPAVVFPAAAGSLVLMPTQNTGYDFVLLQASSQGPRVSAAVYLRCCWQVGSALLVFVRRRCDCSASSAPPTYIQTYLLTYRPQRDGRLSRPWCEVSRAEIRTRNLPIANPALCHTATSAPVPGETPLDFRPQDPLISPHHCWRSRTRPFVLWMLFTAAIYGRGERSGRLLSMINTIRRFQASA